MRARAGAVAVLLLLLGTLAGCGEAGEQAAGAEQSTTAGADGGKHREPRGQEKTDRKPNEDAPSDPGSQAGSLADEAEELAGEQGEIPPRTGPVLGADISWPQCPKGMGIPEKRTLGMPMPLPEAEYVVIGLTNGPGFTPNPCLADQVRWAKERRLMVAAYAVSSYPDAATLEKYGEHGPFDPSTEHGRLQNVGYQQARYNVASMTEAGLETPVVWLDVEPVPDFEWSADPAANAAVVQGVARGYTDAGYRIGVYSNQNLWRTVVGDFSLGGVPEWRPVGETSRERALEVCDDAWSFQGGDAVMGQWVEASRDQNVTCPGVSSDLGRWFHQY